MSLLLPHSVVHSWLDLTPLFACPQVFGSCAMGLTLPSSDIDFVIQLPEGAQVPGHPPRQTDGSSDLSSFDVSAAIHTLASCLMTVPWLSSLCPIDTAAVPVIKCTASALALNIPASQGTSLSFFADIRHIPVDITFDTGSHSGLPTCEYVRRVLAESEYELLELVLVVKELLAQYGLNTPYSGGLSSYAVILLAKACIDVWRRMPPPPRLRGRTSSTATDSTAIERTISDELNGEAADPPAPERPGVGQLFVMFLRLYGRNFDPLTTGVDVTREDSPLFPIMQPQEAFHVLVIDPLDPTRNVAKAAFAFRQVQWVFSQCLATLETAGCALCHRHPNAEVLKLLIRY
jgi:non-canonical poly(A) RNA polymerase PAPD5/7